MDQLSAYPKILTESWPLNQTEKHHTVGGIDVGGPRKGFHASLIRLDGSIDLYHSCSEVDVAKWFRDQETGIIAIDAPCQWRHDPKPRTAETALVRLGIRCFFTPDRDRAVNHPTGYFDWMLQGERLYHSLAISHKIYQGDLSSNPSNVCFETFPHAVSTLLSGKITGKSSKFEQRSHILLNHGLKLPAKIGIDHVDALICALTAVYFLGNLFQSLGDRESGLIVLPKPCKNTEKN